MTQTLQYFIIAALSLALLTAIVLAGRYLFLRTDEEIFQAFIPNTLLGLDPYIIHHGERCYARDRAFWEKSDGYRGLCRRMHNAVCSVRLVQRKWLSGTVNAIDFTMVARTAVLMSLFTASSLFEEPFRLIFHEMPHASALAATTLFAEIDATMMAIFEGNTDILDRLRAVV